MVTGAVGPGCLSNFTITPVMKCRTQKAVWSGVCFLIPRRRLEKLWWGNEIQRQPVKKDDGLYKRGVSVEDRGRIATGKDSLMGRRLKVSWQVGR